MNALGWVLWGIAISAGMVSERVSTVMQRGGIERSGIGAALQALGFFAVVALMVLPFFATPWYLALVLALAATYLNPACSLSVGTTSAPSTVFCRHSTSSPSRARSISLCARSRCCPEGMATSDRFVLIPQASSWARAAPLPTSLCRQAAPCGRGFKNGRASSLPRDRRTIFFRRRGCGDGWAFSRRRSLSGRRFPLPAGRAGAGGVFIGNSPCGGVGRAGRSSKTNASRPAAIACRRSASSSV